MTKIKEILRYFDIYAFQQDLITWYEENKRDLPWRKNRDPYQIWVSEIMLQQTKVDTVIPYFKQFISKYPTLHSLAKADQQDVLKAWEGLGYYSRAQNLQNAVREVVAKYNGEIPSNSAELGSLKGIGPYTKGAILSIAFNKSEPAVDGNVMRVLSRVFKIEADISQQPTKKKIEAYAQKIISKENPSSFNQGIMELGALVCTPKSPKCTLCPIRHHCIAYREGIQQSLPIKSKGKRKKVIPYVTLLIKNKSNQYIIEQRSDTGLLANLWQFPMVPINDIGLEHMENWLQGEYGIQINNNIKKGTSKHVFSHIVWHLEIYETTTNMESVEDARLRFVSNEEIKTYPFPVSHQKIMKYIN